MKYRQPIKLLSLKNIVFISFIACVCINNVGHATNTEKIEITDSHGKWVFDSPPKRVAVINWTLSEQLFELGVEPIAIADLPGFIKTSPQTRVSPISQDLGSRFTPDLKKLRQLAPELIIIGYSQRDLLRPLSNIAPVMYFNNFSRRFDNAKKADERFLVLAKLFGKTEFAEQRLQHRDQGLNRVTSSLNDHFKGDLPQVTIASIKKDSAWLFLNNSIPFSVAQQLGFKPSGIEKKPSKLGTHKVNVKELAELDGCILLLNSDPIESVTVKNPHCNHTLLTTHAYGGSLSQLHIAQSIEKAFYDSHFITTPRNK